MSNPLVNTSDLAKRDDCAVIIQARINSSRFPGKMMSLLGGVSLLEYVYRRCRTSTVKKIAIATSDEASDDGIYEWCKRNSITVIRGSLNNVLKRYIKAAEYLKAKYIIRVCGDSPFVAVDYIDLFLKKLIADDLDYVTFLRGACISGFYSEAVTLPALKKIESTTVKDSDLEHVTEYIAEHLSLFKTKFIQADLNPGFAQNLAITIDYPADMLVVEKIVKELPDKFVFTPEDILAVIQKLNF